MTTRIKLRRDDTTNWTALNPVLALGEPGYETTTGALKIGDGVTAWNSLAYFSTGGGGGTGTYTLVTATNIRLGGVKIGSGIAITNDGTISASSLTTATASVLGGVKVGSGLAIDAATGVLSATNNSNTGNFVFTNNSVTVADNTNMTLVTGGSVNLFGQFVKLGNASTPTIVTDSGSIIMPNGSEITGSSGNTFSLRSLNAIHFNDGSTLSSGFPATTSTLVKGAYTVSLGSTGTLTLAGNLKLPQVQGAVNYDNVEATSVSGYDVFISGAGIPTPLVGWEYNGIAISQVLPLSGNWHLVLAVGAQFGPGFYTLTANPGVTGNKIIFSDGSVQSTAYTGFTTATIDLSQVNQDIVPDTAGTRDLGSVSSPWHNLYVSSSTIHLGSSVLSVAGGSLTLDGSPVISTATGDTTWMAPDSTTWEIKTYTGNFAGTYVQDIRNIAVSYVPAFAETNTSSIYVSRIAYPNIDNIFPTQTEIKVDGGSALTVLSIVYDVYADGVIINIQESVALTLSSNIAVKYTTPGSGPLKWFDFAQTPNNGANLLGGEIKFQAVTMYNDGLGAIGGNSMTLTFNNPGNSFDQVNQVFGNTPEGNYVTFDNSTSTGGFSYFTDLGLGQNDRIKVQWSATLFYNGTWA